MVFFKTDSLFSTCELQETVLYADGSELPRHRNRAIKFNASLPVEIGESRRLPQESLRDALSPLFSGEIFGRVDAEGRRLLGSGMNPEVRRFFDFHGDESLGAATLDGGATEGVKFYSPPGYRLYQIGVAVARELGAHDDFGNIEIKFAKIKTARTSDPDDYITLNFHVVPSSRVPDDYVAHYMDHLEEMRTVVKRGVASQMRKKSLSIALPEPVAVTTFLTAATPGAAAAASSAVLGH